MDTRHEGNDGAASVRVRASENGSRGSGKMQLRRRTVEGEVRRMTGMRRRRETQAATEEGGASFAVGGGGGGIDCAMAAPWLLVVLSSAWFFLLVQGGGLNPAIEWNSPKDLTAEFLAHNTKPIMTIIHKRWCGACRHLKEELSKDEADDFVKLSEEWVMVDGGDDDEPKADEYAPDGGYIPRIIFSEANGKVRNDIVCQVGGNPSYKYFYHSLHQVTETMKYARNVLSPPQPSPTPLGDDGDDDEKTEEESAKDAPPGDDDSVKVEL
ncbi:hypothetical protein CBR_g31404 [Chara braunii]|uniref:Thioredoxin domain-containing protein n=1 Tax=Chara braunii TaxID=69332 RepID=A0A388LEV5_CHABU|nr:hypothetical protein CBR_g31404 [Chara braunii]|eukprot:GBG80849.1 hypothetical protein CBR_g31404 [Chara braunii]